LPFVVRSHEPRSTCGNLEEFPFDASSKPRKAGVKNSHNSTFEASTEIIYFHPAHTPAHTPALVVHLACVTHPTNHQPPSNQLPSSSNSLLIACIMASPPSSTGDDPLLLTTSSTGRSGKPCCPLVSSLRTLICHSIFADTPIPLQAISKVLSEVTLTPTYVPTNLSICVCTTTSILSHSHQSIYPSLPSLFECTFSPSIHPSLVIF
jgi:hypothetical protein